MNKRRLLAAGGAGVGTLAAIGISSVSVLGAVSHVHAQSLVAKCNAGDFDQCRKTFDYTHGQITNKKWLDLKAAEKAAAEKKAAEAKARKAELEAQRKAYAARVEAEEKARQARYAEQRRKAEAKFKAEGWWEQRPGIFVRWCTDTCDSGGVIGNGTYALMEVWAKDRAAGDIYAQVNLLRNGVVSGWTNDTLFLSKGQKGVLTFDTYRKFDTAQLTKFNVSGSW